jgi:hypothetical protein
VILVPVAIWIYTLVFGFASLWFSHYCLAALVQLRAEQALTGTVQTKADNASTSPEESPVLSNEPVSPAPGLPVVERLD